MNAAANILPQESAQRWREFWLTRASTLDAAGMQAYVTDQNATVTNGDGALFSFSHTDIPADIDRALSAIGERA